MTQYDSATSMWNYFTTTGLPGQVRDRVFTLISTSLKGGEFKLRQLIVKETFTGVSELSSGTFPSLL
jgi:hypothetical protein